MSLSSLFFFVLGILLLYIGAETTVKGGSRLALGFGIRPIIVGMTVISIGTSFPEFTVSLIAAARKTEDIALGNIIGSNIANIGLVVSLSAIIRPLTIRVNTVKREMPFLIVALLIFYLLCLDKTISRMDGIILFGGFILFMIYLTRMAVRDRKYGNEVERELLSDRVSKKATLWNAFLSVIGLGILVLGSYLCVKSANDIAIAFGISRVVISLTMIAVGTSLPELVVSSLSAYRGHVDFAVGNVVGSNIFNTLFVIALVSIIYPIPVDANLLHFEYPVMIGFSIIFLPIIISGFIIRRWEGVLLLVLYMVFIYILFLRMTAFAH